MIGTAAQKWLGRATLVAADDAWALLAVTAASVALAVWLERKYAWAARASGVILAMACAMILSNLGVIPTRCALYDTVVWDYAVPMGIALLMLQCNLKTIWRQTGRMLAVFLIGSVGTIVGAFCAHALFSDAIADSAAIAGMMTGSYIGGSINFAAIAAEFAVADELISSVVVADNLLMAVYFFLLILFANLRAFRARFPHPDIEAAAGLRQGPQAAAFGAPVHISLQGIALAIAFCVVVVWLARLTSGVLGDAVRADSGARHMLGAFLGSQYIWITVFSVAFATVLPGAAAQLTGAQEIGTYLIYLFLFVIGVPASVVQIVCEMPLLFAFTLTMVCVNMCFCFVGGRLLGYGLEEIILASNANIGGPTTAAGMAISQRWNRLVGAAMLTGTLGYVLGNYAGIFVGVLLGADI